jgi:hypothetical protein
MFSAFLHARLEETFEQNSNYEMRCIFWVVETVLKWTKPRVSNMCQVLHIRTSTPGMAEIFKGRKKPQ